MADEDMSTDDPAEPALLVATPDVEPPGSLVPAPVEDAPLLPALLAPPLLLPAPPLVAALLLAPVLLGRMELVPPTLAELPRETAPEDPPEDPVPTGTHTRPSHCRPSPQSAWVEQAVRHTPPMHSKPAAQSSVVVQLNWVSSTPGSGQPASPSTSAAAQAAPLPPRRMPTQRRPMVLSTMAPAIRAHKTIFSAHVPTMWAAIPRRWDAA